MEQQTSRWKTEIKIYKFRIKGQQRHECKEGNMLKD